MRSIVDGIKKEFKACVQVERVNFHSVTKWHELLSPMGTPDFALLDSTGNVIYRWIGFTEKEEFVDVIRPRCAG